MSTVTIVIPGQVVPYTRVGRERWTDRAHRYLAWRDGFARDLAAQVPRPIPVIQAGAVELSVTFARHVMRGDLDNLLKAVSDAANGILWTDDRQVRRLTATVDRCAKGEDVTGITVREVEA